MIIKPFFIVLAAALAQMTILAAFSWHGAAPNIIPAALALAAFETGAYHLLLPGVLAAGIVLNALSALPFAALPFALAATIGALALTAAFFPHRALWHCMAFAAVAAVVYDGAVAAFAYGFVFTGTAGGMVSAGVDIGPLRVAQDTLVAAVTVAILYPFRGFVGIRTLR